MRFRSYDALKIFDAVARTLSMTKAADEVHQSKGSISYQINKLEAELGFRLFERAHAKLGADRRRAQIVACVPNGHEPD